MTDPAPPETTTIPARMADGLREIARQVGNLSPDWARPERFYEARSEIAEALRRTARRLDQQDDAPHDR